MKALDNLARQLQRETQAHDEAVASLRRKYHAANERAYASSNLVGQAALRSQIHNISQHIQKRYGALTSGRAGIDAETVVQYLKGVDPDVLALITLKILLDVLGKEPKPNLVTVTTSVGKAIQLQIRLEWYYKENPELYKNTEHWFHSSTGTRQRATVLKRAFNKAGIKWHNWSPPVIHKVGSWLIDCVATTTGWITKDLIQTGKRSRTTVIRYKREFLQMRDTILAKAERYAFCQWPMLCPPIDWSNDHAGGYLTESIRNQYKMVRSQKVRTLKQGDIPIAMLNRVQSVAWRVNPVILKVQQHCQRHQISIGKFVCEKTLPDPERPPGELTDEQLSQWKRQKTHVRNHNAQNASRNWRSTEVLHVAEMYADEPCWFVPHSLDYRGRCYPLVTALSPQGTDAEKALLYFAEEGVVDPWWLAFQVSNSYGNDKLPMDERIQWTHDNHELITRIATDPIGSIPEWENAADPWQFMAACCEYHACVLGDKQTSGLPCFQDATCSGLQHLSALTRDANAAALVNVTPGDKPQDGYRTVAEFAAERLPHPYNTWMNRKVTKRVVMCCSYGLQRDSARSYIRDALREQGRDLSEPGVLTQIVRVVYDEGVPAIFAGPVEVMKWLQACSSEILNRQDHIQWTTPSGFVVRQDLRKPNGIRVNTKLLGSQVKCIVADGYADPDRDHHKNALAPNAVHALDASQLHLTFAFWDKPFATIHDCIAGRSCDMDEMARDIRQHFAEIYKDNVLQDWADQVGVDIPEGLIKNTLDIEQVNSSKYFFC